LYPMIRERDRSRALASSCFQPFQRPGSTWVAFALAITVVACDSRRSASGRSDSGSNGSADVVGLQPAGGDATGPNEATEAATAPDGVAGEADVNTASATDGPSDMLPDVGVPPLPLSATLRSLTATQWAELCDWENAPFGGYNHSSECRVNPMSQALCVFSGTSQPYCAQTVGDVIACTYAQLAELPSCDNPAECQVLLALCPDSGAGSE
jgi:hypothetical protein